MTETKIRAITVDDWLWMREIYAQGIATGNATFEVSPADWSNWDQSHLSTCRLAATVGEELLGWAALSPVSTRRVYAGVAEVSIYVSAPARGRGTGKRLLEHLVEQSEHAGLWTLQAGLFPENTVSLQLHLSCGFRRVGIRHRLGRLKGRWRDVILLERRSPR